jgi:hypothetical protein
MASLLSLLSIAILLFNVAESVGSIAESVGPNGKSFIVEYILIIIRWISGSYIIQL